MKRQGRTTVLGCRPNGWPRTEGWEGAIMVGMRTMWQRSTPTFSTLTPPQASQAARVPLSLFME